VKSEMT